jgi:hypothetical protein
MLTAAAFSAPGQTAESLHLDFVTHAAFFSGEKSAEVAGVVVTDNQTHASIRQFQSARPAPA